MLIAGDGRAAGLLSGGCLEADLMERARSCARNRRSDASRIRHAQFGRRDLGHRSRLRRRDVHRADAPRSRERVSAVAFIEACRRDDIAASFALIARCEDAARPLGTAYWPGATRAGAARNRERDRERIASRARGRAAINETRCGALATTVEASGVTALVAPIELPPRLLVLGAGPDAMPLVEIAGLMNWRITVLDHRPAYAVAERFPRARRVALNAAGRSCTRSLLLRAMTPQSS